MRPPAGDGKSGAVAGGGSGGAIDFAVPTATMKGIASVTATLAAALLDARGTGNSEDPRGNVELKAISAFDVSSSADTAGGGVISVGAATASTTWAIPDDRRRRRRHVDRRGARRHDPRDERPLPQLDGARRRRRVISWKTANTYANVDNDLNASVGEASIRGDGNVLVHVDSKTTGYTFAETSVRRLGAGGGSDNTTPPRHPIGSDWTRPTAP